MDNTIGVIEDWLEGKCDADLSHQECCIEKQETLLMAMFHLCEERLKYADLFEGSMKKLFVLSRHKEAKVRDFVMLFTPSLIFAYLSAISLGDKSSASCVELVLIALYNSEVVTSDGRPKVASFKLPTLARASIYHDPHSLSPTSFSQASLRRLEALEVGRVSWGPPAPLASIGAAKRDHVVTALMVATNAQLGAAPPMARLVLCKAASRLVCQGFPRRTVTPGSLQGSSELGQPRVAVSSNFLAEITHAIYFAMFGASSPLCVRALDDVHWRAHFEVFPEVMLMTSAIKDAAEQEDPCESSTQSPSVATPTAPLAKNCITNASFRTKKLPDDIPIQQSEAHDKSLSAITEDSAVDENGSNVGGSGSTNEGSGAKATVLRAKAACGARIQKRRSGRDDRKSGSDFDSGNESVPQSAGNPVVLQLSKARDGRAGKAIEMKPITNADKENNG